MFIQYYHFLSILNVTEHNVTIKEVRKDIIKREQQVVFFFYILCNKSIDILTCYYLTIL